MKSPDAMDRVDVEVLGRDDVSHEGGRTPLRLEPGGQGRPEPRPALVSLAPALLVVTAFLGCAWLSWRRLGSLVIDGGKELEVPRRVLEGGALYRDIFWNWGPLAPWVNAGLYGLFGVHSDTQMWAGLVTAALACLGLYLLARRFVGPFTSAWVAIAFLTVSAFARRIDWAIFNFVAPFNFSATYGITLAIWSVLLLVHHARSGKPTTLAGSAALAGLVALTKMETTFAVAVAHGAFLVSVLPRPGRARVVAWASGIAVAAVGYGVAARLSQGQVWRSLVELLNGGSGFYIANSMGLQEFGLSLAHLAASLAGWAVMVVTARGMSQEKAGPRELLVIAWVALLVVPAFIVREKVFRAAPLLVAAGLVWILMARKREGEAALQGRWREHLVVWAFALAALPRMLLRSGVDGYGFFLLPPTLVCTAIAMTHYLAMGRGPPRSPRVLAIAASTVLAGVALDGFIVSCAQLTKPMTEVRTDRVWRMVDAYGPEATLIPYLNSLPPSTVCASVPDGLGLVFAAGLTPPDDGMFAYIPMHVPTLEAERAVIRAWERKPPDVIIHWTEDQSRTFGYAGFGWDYGLELWRWISERYVPDRVALGGTATLLVRRQGR